VTTVVPSFAAGSYNCGCFTAGVPILAVQDLLKPIPRLHITEALLEHETSNFIGYKLVKFTYLASNLRLELTDVYRPVELCYVPT
jgi:hypothetical protein